MENGIGRNLQISKLDERKWRINGEENGCERNLQKCEKKETETETKLQGTK